MVQFTLRRYKRDDAASLQKSINHKQIAKNTLVIPYPYAMKDAHSFLRKVAKDYNKKKRKNYNLTIDIAGEVAGGIGFYKIDYTHDNAEIGYWLAKKHWGMGIMTRAVKQMCRLGFQKFGFKRIYAFTFVFNRASQRVLKKAGFHYEGKLRKNVKKKGKYRDDLLFAKIR